MSRHHDTPEFIDRDDTAVIQRGLDELDRTAVKVDEITKKAEELTEENKRATETIKRERTKPPGSKKKEPPI